MRNNILIEMNLAMENSLAYAGPGASKMSSLMGEGFEMTTYSMRKLPSIPRSNFFMVKRFLSTLGDRPTNLVKLQFQQDKMTIQKIRFLDRSHERYICLNQSYRLLGKKK